MTKIVVLDGYSANPGDSSWKELDALGDVAVYERTKPAEIIVRAADADIVLTNKVVLSKEIIAQLPKLRYVGVLATGYNVVDVKSAHERDIVVTNVPAYSTESVAQMVFAHLLTVTNRVEHYAVQNRAGRWTSNPDFCYWDFPHMELAGKTFVEKVSLEELLSISDVLSLHCPLTESTRHLINADSLQHMKPSAILINTGRGPLVDDGAVAAALDDNRLAAFCADVLTDEPPKSDNPLLRHQHAYITPHIAWASFEARIRLLQVAIGNVRAFLEGNPVNAV